MKLLTSGCRHTSECPANPTLLTCARAGSCCAAGVIPCFEYYECYCDTSLLIFSSTCDLRFAVVFESKVCSSIELHPLSNNMLQPANNH